MRKQDGSRQERVRGVAPGGFRRKVWRTSAVWCSAVLLALALPTQHAVSCPSVAEVESALDLLGRDLRRGIPEALDTLSREGSTRSLRAVASFAVQARDMDLSLLALGVLLRHGTVVAQDLVRSAIAEHSNSESAVGRGCTLLGAIPGPLSADLLAQYARDQRDAVAVLAIHALSERTQEGSRTTILSLLDSKRPPVARAAAQALGCLAPTKDTVALLWNQVKSKKVSEHSDVCAVALARCAGDTELPDTALRELVRNPECPSFAPLARFVLLSAAAPSDEAIRTALRSSSEDLRSVACDLVGYHQLKGHQKALMQVARGARSYLTAASAWLALRRVGIDEVRDEVSSTIRQKGAASYWAIQCALRHPCSELDGPLREAALDSEDVIRSDLAQQALGAHSEAREQTRKYYVNVASRFRGSDKARAALLGLGHLPDRASFETLLDLLEHTRSRSEQEHILAGLEKMTGHLFGAHVAVWQDWYALVAGDLEGARNVPLGGAGWLPDSELTRLGLTSETSNAVQAGLRWLARHQGLNGSWDGVLYGDCCRPIGACLAGGAEVSRPLGHTGLALLSFCGTRNVDSSSTYGAVLRRAVDYLLAEQSWEGGRTAYRLRLAGYDVAILGQALSEYHRIAQDSLVRRAAQRAIDYIAKVQTPGLAWRYEAQSTEVDASVTSWMLFAAVSGRNAGLDVPEQILSGCNALFDAYADSAPKGECEELLPELYQKDSAYFVDISRYGSGGRPKDFTARTHYQVPGACTPAMTAAGLLSRIWRGWTRCHPFCIGSANELLNSIPECGSGLETQTRRFYPYTWYYGSLAMWQMGGRYWTRWRKRCLKGLVENQSTEGCGRGSWLTPENDNGYRNTLYSTCCAILTLETFYRYPPYLERGR